MIGSNTKWATASAMAACAVTPIFLLSSTLTAAFEGPYAPELWTFTDDADGFLESHTADELIIVGGDSVGSGSTEVIIAVVASGVWNFDYEFEDLNARGGADFPYYLLNGVRFGLSGSLGSLSLAVKQGDSIGFRVVTADGVFGPGVLTITNFSAPVPTAPTLALLGATSLYGRRRR